MGESSIEKRKALQEAIELSRVKKWPIFISSLDRAGRHDATVKELMDRADVKIISVDIGATANEAVLRVHRESARRKGEIVSRTTREALARKKAEGVPLGNRTNLPEAQRIGAAKNQEKAFVKAEEIAILLSREDAERKKNEAEIADLLNEHGIRTDRGLRWSRNDIRRTLERADALLKDMQNRNKPDDYYRNDPLWGMF